MRRLPIFAAGVVMAAVLTAVPVSSAPAGSAQEAQTTEYVVLATEGADVGTVAKAVEAAGGTVKAQNAAIGMVTARTGDANFAREVSTDASVAGVARNRVIGVAPDVVRNKDDVERLTAAERSAAVASEAVGATATGTEPLAGLQWDMDMIHAPEAHETQIGDHRTQIGILDTGVDGSHPDIAPNFNADLSRNFTTDIPLIDGPCEEDPDGSCDDPADVDEDGHGTHVAGTIGSPINDIGIAGVAPGVELVNLRAGQDSGYFFLQPSVDALTYAADNGIDVVNMSYFIDPWLYNSAANPADSPEEQLEQQTIIEATQRALDYAHAGGVTLVSAEGNGHTDLGNPTFDDTSPDYPPGNEKERVVDNTCLTMPTEGDHVIGVTAIGPSGRKAYYSDYGLEQADVSAPGGDFYDFDKRSTEHLILAPYPTAVGIAIGDIDPVTGESLTPFVVADCGTGECSYYQYLQGTSMASPHAVGVAALIVAEYGRSGPTGFGLSPDKVGRILARTATDTPCPPGGVIDYPHIPSNYNAVCEGTLDRNGFYGDGIVDALAAVSGG